MVETPGRGRVLLRLLQVERLGAAADTVRALADRDLAPDLVVCTGDATDDELGPPPDLPWVVCQGRHDVPAHSDTAEHRRTRRADLFRSADLDPDGPAYRVLRPHPAICLVLLDTVDPDGDLEGALDDEQLAWLRQVLSDAWDAEQVVVLASHHGLGALASPATAARVEQAIAPYPNLAAWLSGHVDGSVVGLAWRAGGAFWQVTTGSSARLRPDELQGRLVEVVVDDTELGLRTTMADPDATGRPDDLDAWLAAPVPAAVHRAALRRAVRT